MDLPRPTSTTSSLRLRAAQITLRRMRAQGHDYLDLRQDGKRIIYLCILCLKPCYSEPILFQHLDGNEHKKAVEYANLTMRLQNPWPFNDGMVFFNWEREQQHRAIGGGMNGQVKLIEASGNGGGENAGALVMYSGNVADGNDKRVSVDVVSDVEAADEEDSLVDCIEDLDLVVPGVLWKGDVSDLELKYLGLGQIGVRYYKLKNDKSSDKISRIWCQWLGEKRVDDEDIASLPELDVAVVTFRYAMELSMGWEDEKEDFENLGRSSDLHENGRSKKKKRKSKSFSDPEDTSESFRNEDVSSFEDSSSTSSTCKELSTSSSSSSIILRSDDLMLAGSTSSKELRKEIRKRQRVAARRMCDLCHHKMQPGKDVAALLNMKTGKLGCSSRNSNGAFHVFHISCILHWILLCEYERLSNPVDTRNWEHMAKKRRIIAKSQKENSTEPSAARIHAIPCPACQGTGRNIKGGKLEETPISQSQMFKCMIKAFDGKRAWKKNPEILQNCSVGLHYPPQSEEAVVEELIATLRLLRFYTAGDPSEN